MEKKRLSMGKMFIETESLKKLFNLPKEVEFAKVELNLEEDLVEVIVVSADPIERLSAPVTDDIETRLKNRRRVRLPYSNKRVEMHANKLSPEK